VRGRATGCRDGPPTSAAGSGFEGAWTEVAAAGRRLVTRRGLAELVAIVAPPACVACREPLARADELLCGDCLRALPWLRGWCCPRCGLPRHRRSGCPAGGAAFARSWAPMAYEGPARALVQALKFRAALPVVRLMAAQVAATMPDELRRGAVVPVPPQARRRRARGFDPAGALAADVAARLELPLAPVLARRDRAARQTRAGRSARRAAGRIVVEAVRPAPAEVLLVDDVHTTGATLDACARVLVGAGSRVVVAVAYARTL
jgi:predicted amidophosphoribosyltransferase